MSPRRTLVLFCLVAIVASAASARAADEQWAIFVMKSDGSQARKIAQADGHADHTSPRWSHDDKQVVFDASGGARGGREFYLVNSDGSGLRQLGIDGRADWSPDDKQLGFESGGEILVQNLDGQGREKIARGWCARWSPDGSQLAVNDRHQLIVMDLAGGEERHLFGQPYESLFGGYNWSPDGKWLAVSARPKTGEPRHLVLVSSQGDESGMKVRFKGEQGGSISFSPDGKTLAFDNGYQFYLLKVEGTSPPRLIPGQKGRNKDPHWSHDGQSIVFSSDRAEP
jgi:Tol biopolymer transport system component